MSVLPAQEIKKEIQSGRLVKNARDDNVEACSYDMRIGTFFSDGQIIGALHARASDQIIIEPGDILSMFTEEELDLPSSISATAFPLNSQSSKGLLVLNPGHIDPGFKGPLTVKVLNLRRVPMVLTRGMKIFTIIFQRLSVATDHDYNRNQPRGDREREFNATDVELASRTLGQMITFGRKAPFATHREVRDQISESGLTSPAQVKEIVREHWMSWFSLILSLVAAVGAVAIVVIELTRPMHAPQGAQVHAIPPVSPQESTGKTNQAPVSQSSGKAVDTKTADKNTDRGRKIQ
jgi:deoxycytidine triphosphate deaminase